jgi:hypothetical protein
MNIIQTSFEFQDEISKPVFKILRLHNGRYATKKQYIEDQQKVCERKIIQKIRRLEAEKEVDRRKIEALIGWIKVLQNENNKLKIKNYDNRSRF